MYFYRTFLGIKLILNPKCHDTSFTGIQFCFCLIWIISHYCCETANKCPVEGAIHLIVKLDV